MVDPEDVIKTQTWSVDLKNTKKWVSKKGVIVIILLGSSVDVKPLLFRS